MRRGPKPAKSKEAKPPVARKSSKDDGAKVRDLENRLAEALAQQAATSEILNVISRSTFDLTPVLQTLAGNATRLCSADAGMIRKLDGEVLRAVAECGIPRELYEFDQRHPLPPGRGTIAGRAALERRTVHIPDVLADPEYQNTEARQLGGYRTLMAVPMLREGALIGVFVLHRFRVEPFTDRQIGVLQTFADQAVIAIENVRLFTQLQEKNGALTEAHAQVSESLEQQTATSEILRVISSSPTDIQPVLDAVAESAARLCQAFDGSIFRLNEEALLLVAHHGSIPAGPVGQFTLPLVRGTVGGRTVLERQMIHVRDLQQESEQFPEGSSLARRFGHRTILGVPLLREGVSIGCIQIRRAEVEPFTEKQVALLQTFADQAVIAIENVRLFKELEGRNNELTEALEQQTATSEILGVISGSPTDLQPVFGAILANATRLFDSENARIYTFDGEAFHLAAAQKTSPEFQAYVKEHPIRPGRESALRRVGLEKRVVHIPDTLVDPEWAPPSAYQMEGMRTAIAVPLLKGDALIGAITTQRREVRPFTEKQIQLITTFADQAVIAIENVRLFTELQTSNHELTTALDTQTATSDILRVISRSQTDVRPVFDAILASAIHLLNGYTGALTRREGDQITLAALTSTDDASDAAVKAAFPQWLHSRGAHPQTIRDRVPFNVADAHNDARLGVPEGAYASVRGYRSLVVVPLLRHDEAIGTVSVTRREPGGFTNDEIALLQTFADQAVIAIENVRLFTELQEKNRALTQAHAQVSESLEQQTATSEILRVIAASPTDVQPVFETIAQSAARLCEAFDAVVYRVEGDVLRPVTHHGSGEVGPIPLVPGTANGRAVIERRLVHVTDIQAETNEFPEGATISQREGTRSFVSVPLLREGRAIGTIAVRRFEVRPFGEKQIALLRTFADQAVIAIENTRLFKELETRNRDLTEALDRQTATAEILRVISQAQTEVQPVFDAIVDNAVRLFRAWSAAIWQTDGELLHLIAARGGLPGSEQTLRGQSPWPIDRMNPGGRCVAERTVINIPNVERDPVLDPALRVLAHTRGWRSVLAAPIVRDEQPIGAITVTRAEVGSFSPAEVELLQTFAAQAVIAIENARLLTELRARTQQLTRSVEQLTALGEVGRAVSSTLDLETVLITIVSRAVELSGLDGGVVFEYDDSAEEFVQRVATDTGGALAEVRRTTRIRKGEGVLGRTAVTLEPAQVPDISAPGAYESRLRENLIESGIRALLAVPMVREDRLIGCLVVSRNHAGDFPAETIALLRTFATQSALAIQNARLFREIEDKSRQLEVASRHKSEFLANMSHELRTPLNAIIGFSEVLSEKMFGELNEKQEEYSKDIHASGQHLLSLINDILDLSKIEAGRMELELTDFDLPTAIENALMLVRERAGRRSIALHTEIDGRLGQIQADERKVRQVVLNLLSNAIKFTPEGGRIEVGAVPKDGLVEVSVSDTGIGIAPEDQEKVFEEFRQVGTAAKKVEGTGLGLTLCRKFVELHGGKIWVNSEVSVGSTFTFTIPTRRGE